MFFIRAGLHEAFKADAFSSVRVTDFHIKYLGEARPDNPLYIKTGLLERGAQSVRLCHMMFHGDGRIAATIVENIEHISLRTMAAFPWPGKFTAAVKPYPEFLDPEYHASGKSGALLEAQIFIHRRAESGDGYHFYSGLQQGNAYTRSLVHHIFDVVTGECIFSMVGDGCLFDLKARKLIKASDEQVAALQANVVEGLRV